MTVCDKVCQEVASISSLLSCDGRQSALAEDTPGGVVCVPGGAAVCGQVRGLRERLSVHPASLRPLVPEWHVFGWRALLHVRRKREGRREGGRREARSLEPVVSAEDGCSGRSDGPCPSHHRLALWCGTGMAVSSEAALAVLLCSPVCVPHTVE